MPFFLMAFLFFTRLHGAAVLFAEDIRSSGRAVSYAPGQRLTCAASLYFFGI